MVDNGYEQIQYVAAMFLQCSRGQLGSKNLYHQQVVPVNSLFVHEPGPSNDGRSRSRLHVVLALLLLLDLCLLLCSCILVLLLRRDTIMHVRLGLPQHGPLLSEHGMLNSK